MTWLSHLGLVDVIALGLVALSLVGALAGRRGILGAIGSALGTAVLCWLVAAGLLTWGSAPLRSAVADSTLAHVVPVPRAAVDQARDLGGRLATELHEVTTHIAGSSR